ncbi:hypothetical protein BCR33DRAFT_722263 [Rhizoclosmatium globosum]|uniref:Uncharacterized protein n=1 Tax=Rhizoclosmatium globosum TaxID=329046 RepID=A0A1Y2BN46_9FUNG|nr:hypothetical protein BCR33DRAFT_722263 [Rhizoclosmatium globosum]|eukprot:ORY36163.1 hypothetical protein BCR33DRAFT_722263 [Rhizoclosmatium globosum]
MPPFINSYLHSPKRQVKEAVIGGAGRVYHENHLVREKTTAWPTISSPNPFPSCRPKSWCAGGLHQGEIPRCTEETEDMYLTTKKVSDIFRSSMARFTLLHAQCQRQFLSVSEELGCCLWRSQTLAVETSLVVGSRVGLVAHW